MTEFSIDKIRARHKACDGQNFEPFKIWANGLAAHIDRGILLRRLDAAELRARLDIRKVKRWDFWPFAYHIAGYRYFLDGREVDRDGNPLDGLGAIKFPSADALAGRAVHVPGRKTGPVVWVDEEKK